MKANKAPEKIYVALNELTKDGHTLVLDHRVDYPICTEYTHIDAFIEKACEFIKERIVFDDNTWYIEGEVTLKNKVIEDFKNYMKGE